MQKLSFIDCQDLVLGASIFQTGGGLPISKSLEIFQNIFKKVKFVHLADINQFNDDDYLCVVSAVGSVGKKIDRIVTGPTGKEALKILRRYLGKNFVALCSGEVGQEAIIFEIATALKLPVVDGDLKGGRAAPSPAICTFNLRKVSVTPAATVNDQFDKALLIEISDINKIENFMRHFASMGIYTTQAWCPASVSVYKKTIGLRTITRSLKIGRVLKKNKDKIKAILDNLNAKLLFRGRIEKIERNDEGGFLKGKIYLKDSKGVLAQVYFQNEYLVFWKNKKPILTCPDLIAIVDVKTGEGVHNAKVKIGDEVAVFGIPAFNFWHTKRGYELFSPQSFGFKIGPKLFKNL